MYTVALVFQVFGIAAVATVRTLLVFGGSSDIVFVGRLATPQVHQIVYVPISPHRRPCDGSGVDARGYPFHLQGTDY